MSKTIVVAGFMLLLMTACNGTGNDAVARRRAALAGKPTPTAQTATTMPMSFPTSEPAPIVAQQVAGDASGATGMSPSIQLLIVAVALVMGIPTFWTVSLRRLGGNNGQPTRK